MGTPEEKAKLIVSTIIKDLTGRAGLRQQWESIDDDIQDEIRKSWEGYAFEVIVGLD